MTTATEQVRPEDTPQTKVVAEAVQPVDSSQPGTALNTLAKLRESRRYMPPEEEAPEEGEDKTAESVSQSGEEPSEGEGEEPPVTGSGSPSPEGEQRFKYKSHEEAERAYREAERRMHQATTEKAALQKELEELKARLAALEQERQEQVKPVPPQKEEAVARLVELNERIDELDPFDPDYARQKAELEMEKAFILDAVKAHQAIPSPEVVKDLVRQELAAREQEMARSRAMEELQQRVIRMAESYGLDMKPGSWDYKQFWRAVRAGDIPDGENITLEDQVKALAEEILADKAGFGQRAVQKMQRLHEENAPLGRGGTGPPGGGQEGFRPSSIHDIIAANRRRI